MTSTPTLTRAEARAQWREALRTTTARQTHTIMTDSRGGFCALGLGCDALGIPLGPGGSPYSDLEDATGIPWPVVKQIYALNDFDRRSFAEIADWLEEHEPEFPS